MKKLVLLLFVVLLTGCATSNMKKEVYRPDGSKDVYSVDLSTLFQDFKGSDLSATLDPKGKTTVKAGAVDNTASQYSAEVAKSFVELFIAILPYIATPPAAP